MARLESSVTINRPVEEVFAFLSNYENDPKWSSATVEATKTSEGPIGVGTTWRSVSEFLGRRSESELEYIEYELNRKIAIKQISGPYPHTFQVTLDLVEGGTKVNFVGEFEFGGFFGRIAAPLFMRIAKRQLEAGFVKLKRLMEAGAL